MARTQKTLPALAAPRARHLQRGHSFSFLKGWLAISNSSQSSSTQALPVASITTFDRKEVMG